MVRRADRLFEIIQLLRGSRTPLTAGTIARELETSARTIYRDISALMARRVPIRGEAGIGYVLDAGFDLPPLMLTIEEVEAAVLGGQWVIAKGDPTLSRAARSFVAKIAASLPERLRPLMLEPVVATPPAWHDWREVVDVGRLRVWCRSGCKLILTYEDERGTPSTRTVWPFLIGYAERHRTLMAWCELRQDFRMFRLDRLTFVDFRDERYPARPATLQARWRAKRMTERGTTAGRDGEGRSSG